MIEFKDVYKSYGKKKVLKGLSLSIKANKIIGLVGVNGAGKSTLLSIMSSVLEKDSGSIIFNGKEISRQELSHLVAFVPQDNALIEDVSVKDNLKLWHSRGKKRSSIENNPVVKSLGVDKFINEKVKNLSGGMKKRLSLSCALAENPKILLMDEPLSSLDLVVKNDIRNYLMEFRDKGGAVVISSHDREDFDICDELYLLKDGELILLKDDFSIEELTKILKHSERHN